MSESTVICKICQQETSDPVDFNGHSICKDCDAKVCDYADKVESRKDRLYAAAERIARDGQAIQSRARTMSDAIPFGQPILVGHHSEKRDRNYRERIRNTYQRGFERLELAAQIERKANAAAKNRAVSSDDPAAVIKLEEKLSKLEAQQEEFKRINKIIQGLVKKPRTTKAQKEDYERRRREAYAKPGVEAMNAFHREEDAKAKAAQPDYASLVPKLAEQAKIGLGAAVKLLTPDFMGRVGIPSYELTNSNAEIRRLKARIEELKTKQIKAVEAPEEVIEIGWITITLDRVDNRVKIEFPGKPIDQVIALCKANGFHWSRPEGVWMRMLSNSATYWAKHIASETLKLVPAWATEIVKAAPALDPDSDYDYREDRAYPPFDTQVFEPVYLPESLRIERAIAFIRGNLNKKGHMGEWEMIDVVRHYQSGQVRLILRSSTHIHQMILFMDGELIGAGSSYWRESEWPSIPGMADLWHRYERDYWTECDTNGYPAFDAQEPAPGLPDDARIDVAISALHNITGYGLWGMEVHRGYKTVKVCNESLDRAENWRSAVRWCEQHPQE